MNLGFNKLAILGQQGLLSGIMNFLGLTSGTVTVQVQDTAGTYNFNLPTTAGSSGQALVSGGGSAAPMTWADLATADDVAHLVTLSGVATDATHLGTFTGATISDSRTNKQALQELETAVETKGTAASVSAVADDVANLVTLSGVATDATHLGTFTGATISDSRTLKQALQDLETALELKQPLDSDLTLLAALTTQAFGRGLLETVSATAARAMLGSRTTLTGNTTFYVRTDGTDTLSGRDGLTNSSGSAFATFGYAYNNLCANYDLAGFTATIKAGNTGTWSYVSGSAVLDILGPWTGGGSVVFEGDTTTPSNCVLSTATNATHAFRVASSLPGTLVFKGFKVTATGTSGSGINHLGIGSLHIGYIEYGACTSWHIALGGPSCEIKDNQGNSSITGNANTGHILCNAESYYTKTTTTTTVFGARTFAFFLYCTRLSLLELAGGTVWPLDVGSSGAVTTSVNKYDANANSVIYASGVTIPGTGGTTATGGQII